MEEKARWNIGKKITVTALLTSILSLVFLLVANVVSAERETSDETLLNEYEKLDSILNISSGWMYDDVARATGWGLIKLLVWVNDLIEGIVTKIILLNDFYSSPQMESFMNVAKPLVFGLFVIAIFVLGIQFMLNKIEKREEVLLNVLLAVSILVIIPVLMSNLHNIVSYSVGWMGQEGDTLAGNVVRSNLADIKYYAEKDFAVAGSGTKYVGNNSTPPRPIDKDDSSIGTTDYTYGNQVGGSKGVNYIDINEKLDVFKTGWWWGEGDYYDWAEDDISVKAKELLQHKAVGSGEGDERKVVELRDSSLAGMGKEVYYRYHVNWGTVIFSLIITGFALAITVVKIARVIFDLAFHQIFAMFVAVSDLSGGQRIKKVLAEIANSFAVVFIMVIILKMFTLYANWVSGLKPSIGGVGVVLMLIAGAWAVIDAPDIVQRIMGIDAGLRSGYGALMGAYAGVSLAGKGAKMAKGLATGAVTKGAGLAGAIKGATGGLRGGKGVGSNRTNIPNTNLNSINMDASPNSTSSSENEQIHSSDTSGDRNINRRDSGTLNTEGSQIPDSLNTRTGSYSTLEQARAGEIPQGWQETDSGIITPSGAEGIPSGTTRSSVNKPIEDVDLGNRYGDVSMGGFGSQPSATESLSEQMQQMNEKVGMVQQAVMGYGGTATGGFITGSRIFNHARYSFQRGAKTGEFIGSSIRRGASLSKKATLGSVRAVAHPKQTINLAGYKIHQAQSKVANIAQSGASRVKGGLKNAIREIRTPLGYREPLSNREIKINNNQDNGS